MAGGLANFGGKLAPPFKKKGTAPGTSDARKRMLIARLKRQEGRLENKGGAKTPAETRLEQRIGKLGGAPYVGKR